MNKHIIKDIPLKLSLLQNKILKLCQEGKIEIQNGDEGYATAPSNIALIKYWGKLVEREQLPVNSSISYTLGGFRSFTKVTALGRFFPEQDEQKKSVYENKLFLEGEKKEKEIPKKMDRLICSLLHPFAQEISLKVESKNNFPTASGIASSASGYAALVAAVADLLQLNIHFTEEELAFWLTEWSRLGSGSAARSAVICEGDSFVEWEAPLNKVTGFSNTKQLKFHPKWRKLQHCVFVLDENEKKTSSSEGHKYAHASPLQTVRVAGIPARIKMLEKSLLEHDFEAMQFLSEEDAFNMHAVMQTGNPPACYLNNKVADAIALFVQLRNEHEVQAFWTLDAGSNIHILFMPEANSFLQILHSKMQEKFNCSIKVLANSFRGGLALGKETYEELVESQILIHKSFSQV